MRRIAVFLMALVMIACLGSVAYADGVSAGPQTIIMNIYVAPYIAVNPSYNPWTVNFGTLNPGAVPPNPAQIAASSGFKEVAYSNVKFRVDLVGNNGALDGYPIFARQEVAENGTPIGRWDRLSTHLSFRYCTNGIAWGPPDHDDQTIVFDAPGGNNSIGTWGWGRDYANLKLPHDGDIWMIISTSTNMPSGVQTTRLPHTTPDWSRGNEWWESADAGTYSCWVLATYTQRPPYIP